MSVSRTAILAAAIFSLAPTVYYPTLLAQRTRLMSTDHPAAPADAETDIRAIIDDQAAAWNRHDAAGWASRFVPTAEFINILGTPFSGKTAIEGITTRIFASIFKDSYDVVTVRKVIFVTPELAIAHYEHAVSGYTALPPGIQPSETGAEGKGVLRTLMVYVLKKGADSKWMIVNGQNTAILPALQTPG
ncbi:MAG: SgcJ/EcaC family oxidoreductase [Gemmatimonadaceae bacterium]|nr:SgcJ/EcaC family oxidoreductase [Gemmatimonadaceae bacterium]